MENARKYVTWRVISTFLRSRIEKRAVICEKGYFAAIALLTPTLSIFLSYINSN